MASSDDFYCMNDESLAQTLASNQQINSPYIGGDENTRHKSITALNSPFISGSENTRHKSITALNSPFISGLEDKRHKLIQQLRHAIMMFDYQRDLYREKANTCIQTLNARYDDEEEKLHAAMEVLADERIGYQKQIQDLSSTLATTRVELNRVQERARNTKQTQSKEVKEAEQKVKSANQDRVKSQSELSALRVKFNDLQRKFNEQRTDVDKLREENKKLKENNVKCMSELTKLRLQSRRPSTPAAQPDVTVNSGRRSSFGSTIPTAPAPQTRHSSADIRTPSALRFSNRIQIRDITPPPNSSSSFEQVEQHSPPGLGSEIHTARCRYDCHLYEHEGDEGRFRWVCGTNDQIMVLYKERRYAIFIPDVAEIQLMGEGETMGQLIIYWTTNETTVFHTNGVREEYRYGEGENVIYYEQIFPDNTAFRITGEERVPIEPNEETPLVANVQRILLQGHNDLQVTHPAFGLRIKNHEFLRIIVNEEALQITMCLCEGKRVFNVKHCFNNFQQKTLCTFLGQCPNMPIR